MKAIAIAILMSFPSSALAFVVEDGADIKKVSAEMKAAKYSETGLQVVSAKKGVGLMFWNVDEGMLIVGYSERTGIVDSVSFKIPDYRPKLYQRDVSFSVKRFDTTTGELLIQTKQK